VCRREEFVCVFIRKWKFEKFVEFNKLGVGLKKRGKGYHVKCHGVEQHVLKLIKPKKLRENIALGY